MTVQIINNIIAIDTEYHTNTQGIIDKVFCLGATNASGERFSIWTGNYSANGYKTILDDVATHYGLSKDSMILICHALDKAERRSLKFLGVDHSQHQYLDTYHLAKMLKNSFSKSDDQLALKDSALSENEKISLAYRLKAKKAKSLSYANLCNCYDLALIDTEHKQAMRQLCIDDATEGYEQEIMEYCCDDTKFLIPLFKHLFAEYYGLLNNSFCPLSERCFNNVSIEKALNCLVLQCQYINEFGDIADNGLPVNINRVNKVKVNALKYREQLKAKFNEQYPGSFEINKKDGLYHENTIITQKYMTELITEYVITDYPKTNSGKLSTSSDTLKDFFKDKDCFGEHYRQLNKLTRLLNVVAKQEDSPFESIFQDSEGNYNLWYESLEPYGTITSRCTPSTKRFLFGWHKSLYGLMEPPKGKWLVELDYGSEETNIQANICHDDTYNKIYHSKDIYLAFATLMGKVPAEDFKQLAVDELKEKYKAVRSMIKPMILGISYGMGANKLAKRCNMSMLDAEKDLNMIKNRILTASTRYKNAIKGSALRNHAKAFSLPDGFICKYDPRTANATTVGNWPFQSAGGMILRFLVHNLATQIRTQELPVKVLATIHDAIFFEVAEGDYETINRISELMKKCANKITSATNENWSIKVGEPDIIKHGSVWTPDNKFNEQFDMLLKIA